ncbi:MAG: hypothetical protein Q8O61_15885, partial [Nocardioides sp.]|nr:hypothetical protein [Nocardioides sp.]
MELHEHLAELVQSVGPQVLDDPDGFRAALDDFLDEGAASTGDINLLVDTVRLGAYGWMVNTISSGGEGARAVEAAGTILARDRGSRDVDSARWACAVLAFAVGKVGDADVRRYRTRSLTEEIPPPAPRVVPDAPTEPVPPPTQRLAPAGPTVRGEPPVDVPVQVAPPTVRRRSLAPVLAVLVVLGLVGGGFAAWRMLGGNGDEDDPAPGSTDGKRTSEPDDVEPLPFEIDAELVNQPCTGQVIVMLATASVPANYADKLGRAIEGVPDAAVLRASDSCDAFQETNPDSGAPIYNAY